MELTKKEILAWFKIIRQQPVRDNYTEILLNIEQALNTLSPEERIKYDIQTIIKTETIDSSSTSSPISSSISTSLASREYTVLQINHTKWQHAVELYFFKGECFKITGY